MRNKWLIVAFVLLAAYVSPYAILGEDAHVRTHDNLDSFLPTSGLSFPPGNRLCCTHYKYDVFHSEFS